MKRALITALAIMTIAAAAEKPKGSDKPNYSDEWKMNPATSNFGQFPPPNTFVRKIEHADPTLSIIEDQAACGGQSTTTRKLTTDGKPKFTDRMSLSPDGKTLTSKVQISSSQGDGDVMIVFDRQ